MRRLVVMAVALAGCWPPSFFDYEDGAPVQVIEKPSSFPLGSFGSTLLARVGLSDGVRQERLLVGSTSESPVFSFALSDGEVVLPSEFETSRLCDPESRTGDEICEGLGVGSALAEVDVWGAGVLCAAIGGTNDAMVVACEHEGSSSKFEGGINSLFGVAVAGIPEEERVLVGSNEDGAFVVERGVEGSVPVDPGECAAAASGFGRAVAATGDFWAIGSTGGEILVVEPDGEGVAVLEVGGGGGVTLVTGDLVGGETEDLVAGGAGEVRVWDGDDLAGAEDCETIPAAVTIACSDFPDRSVVCGGEFGRAIAIGDITDDGDAELLVGDPAARVSDQKRAGVVFVYEGGSLDDPADALVDSQPEADAELGRAVAVGSVLERGEAIGGSNGEVFFFFCTNLPGDRPGDSGIDGCRP